MMTRVSRSMIALYSALSTFFVVLFTLFSYFYSRNQEEWIAELFQRRIFFIPIFIHIVVVSLGVGMLTFFLVSVLQKLQYAKIEEKLRLLASGNYENQLLQEDSTQKKDAFLENIDEDIQAIQEKMLEMSRELQILTSRPQMVSGESKEEILENERHRLARELHDSVSQQLFAAMMMLSALNEQANNEEMPEAFRKQLAMIADIINASQSEMRALLLHLRPVSLEGKSLRQGIEQLLMELQTKIQIELKWEVQDIALNSSIEDHLFRIVQELLSNTLRHAKASELEVYLKKVDNNVMLRLVDDGVGFDITKQKTGSYGLTNIKERVAGMGGTVKIISFKGQGTSIEIKIPFIQEVDVSD